jgi:hypothetical protein
MGAKKYWMGYPGDCNVCCVEFKEHFIDGSTVFGPWANMCPDCHSRHGVGLGTGRGQKYEKQEDGRWLKIAG